jgi:GT2 family glycosyltransferase
MKKVSVIIINYNTAEMTEKVISRLFDCEPKINWEIIVIDNNSKEKFPVDKFESSACRVILNRDNLGFASAVNQGLAIATGDNILLLNSDCLLEKESIGEMLKYLESHSRVGIIGPQMTYPDGKFQSSFGPVPSLWSEFLRFSLLYKIFPGGSFAINTLFKKIDLKNAKQVDWLSGGCMLIRRELINKIGKMDDDYFLGVEDIDFCFRAKSAGFKTIYYPMAKVIHYHGFSSGPGGARSIQRIANDRDGLDYFFKKNFPNKKISRVIIKFLHNLKLKIIK